MRKNKAAEAIFSKYSEPKAAPIDMFTAYRSTKKRKGGSLNDFYHEVHAANSKKTQHPYNNKNATEIESIMVHNRRLIEASGTYKH
ncbi:hypothetical protein [Sulfuricurvum sp.]|uniref:hypothetical protein n=1 Tax=Sulfuricurvum sp. TaxID=2025608 RepID=UPI003568574D